MRALIALAVLVGVVGGVQAQTPSLNELLEEAKSERARRAARDRERIEALRGDRAAQEALLTQLTAQVETARARSAQLNAAFEANEQRLAASRQSVDAQLGDLKELFGIVRQEAADVRAVIAGSLIGAQLGPRTALLDRLQTAERLPSIDDLDALRLLVLEEMTEQANVIRFEAEVFDPAGAPYPAEVVRVGAFNLVTGDRFLIYEPAAGTIKALGRQPAARHRANAAALSAAQSGSVRMTLDPSHGQLLRAIVRTPNVTERIAQGGTVGYVILALGALGLLLALWRVTALLASRARIVAQLRDDTPGDGNALGRVLAVWHGHRDLPTDALELKMDEAILRETPRLEQWQGAIKIIAAVAPLLGLLGTVIGMIDTFQSITLYGTGDPRLMADGISKALVTTMLGLIVAIPLVLLHAVVASLSRGQIEVLEEQSAGLVARRAEAA